MSTRLKKQPRERAEVFGTNMHRRLTLKLLAGTAATTTLAACGVKSTPQPETQVRTNTVVLRGRLQDLNGRNLERLRAIAAFLDPVNRSKVDIIGEYWTVDKALVRGKPGRDFIGDGIDMVVIAKGESAAAVWEWAAQWAGVLDFDGDEAQAIDPVFPARVVPQDAGPTFLVFERRAGAVAPKAVLEADSSGVAVVSHHVLVQDRMRQVLMVRAPSREAVRGWVERWGARQAVEVLQLTNLSDQLRTCARSSNCTVATAAFSAAPLAARAQERVEVADYHPNGLLLTADPKVGDFYFRHQGTGRYLTVDAGGTVLTVPTPADSDRWRFDVGAGLDTGNYYLRHQGTGRYLNGDTQGHVSSSASPQTWASGTTGDQTYGLRKDGTFNSDLAVLTADDQGKVSTSAPRGFVPAVNWEQWTDYNHPSALEQTLHDLVATTAHSAPWPEDAYVGDLKAAYADILTYLNGQAPQGGKVNTAALDTAQLQVTQKYNNVLPPAYATVFEHLYTEVSYLDTLETWYGESGHVQALLNETTISQLFLIDKVRSLAQPAPGLNVKFGVGVFISFLTIVIAAAGAAIPGGAVLGAILAGAWRLYTSASGGGKDTLNITFAKLDDALHATFNDLITRREDTRSAVAADWGKLSFFAGMVADGTLAWPNNTDAVRHAAALQFEISTWQSVANGAWVVSGIGWEDEDSGKPNAAGDLDSPWKLILQYRIPFIPRKAVVEGWVTDWTYIPSGYVPSDAVAQHLFDDPKNGGLGISMPDFYICRNGWAIPPDFPVIRNG